MPTKTVHSSGRAHLPMRMYSRALVATLLLLTVSPAHGAPTNFTFTGSGYGHGVGLSQIGARAMAIAGESATSILKYYYTGVDVTPVVDTQTVRINIAHQVTNLKLRTDDSNAFVRVYTSDQQGLVEVPARTSLTFALHDGAITLTTTSGKRSATFAGLGNLIVRWSGTSQLEGPPSVISMVQQGVTMRYKYGQIGISLVKAAKIGTRLEVTNSLRLGDEYLYGVAEVPSSWPEQALMAQAIASRTYALYRVGTYRPVCDCNMYATLNDQIFVGYAKISDAKYGQFWKSAVDQTLGMAVTYQGQVIPAYYFSSSAGATESALNAFGTAAPFALSVPDSASVDVKLNPRFARWTMSVPMATIASAFLLPDVVELKILSTNETGTVARIEATSSDGRKVSLRGETFRSRAKLPSAWFSLT